MHGKRTLKTVFKVAFLIFQSLLFITGVGLLLATLTFYAKGRKLFSLSAKVLVYLSILCTMLVVSAVSGFRTIGSKERWTVALYIVLILTAINMEALLIMKFPAMTDHVKKTGTSFWQRISEDQRIAIEKSFGCCGLDSSGRKVSCGNQPPCLRMFYKTAWGFRSFAEKTLILLVFGQSLSIGLLCLLKLRK